ncbi:MAG: class I SAM-dependent methyltransferase [Atopobiaceae bacterium]|nr:class I SAM-dependent methyltransferase [Atopobiaceae bacterium]
MAKPTPARKAALAVLSRCRRRDARVRELLRTSKEMESLDVRDRALASRLAFGTVSARGMLDQMLSRHVRRPSSLEPRVHDALLLSAFEICYLQTPRSVAVSQGVELVRSASPRAAGLANAVLRKVVNEEASRVDTARDSLEMGKCDDGTLSLVSGLPSWLVRRVRDARGEDAARDLALSQLEPAPVFVAANRAKHTAAEAVGLLGECGLDPMATDVPSCIRLGRPAGLASSGLVEQVDVVVSDLAAQRVALLAQPSPSERILEIGQGRGTKTVLLQGAALDQGGPATIVGVDSEPFKTRVSKSRMDAAGLSDWVTCVTFDACQLAQNELPEGLEEPFDLVFVDAPCSGTGTMRRHPEIAWSLSESLSEGDRTLPELQLRMLTAASARVAFGGRLLYATCSILPEENEQVVKAFLSSVEGRDFSIMQTEGAPGTFQTLPTPDGCDGHFCYLMQRGA